ncbi:hypothetical protein FRX31_025509, partial [Thalictrum thalictroides]
MDLGPNREKLGDIWNIDIDIEERTKVTCTWERTGPDITILNTDGSLQGNKGGLPQHVGEGWETPKRRHTCRTKDLVLTSQIGDINKGGTQDRQAQGNGPQDWQAQGNGPQDKDPTKDARHDRPKGGKLGQGLEHLRV